MNEPAASAEPAESPDTVTRAAAVTVTVRVVAEPTGARPNSTGAAWRSGALARLPKAITRPSLVPT